MPRWISLLIVPMLLLPGCGNKMDLPSETSGGEIPLDGYFVSSVWNGMGDVTDMLVTKNKWLYIAEDSSSVKRYKGKGSNVAGTIIAEAIESVEGLDRPVALDEGMEDHIFILDMVDSAAVFYTDRPETSHFLVPAVIPVIKLFDIYPNEITLAWGDSSWMPKDSTETFPGRDSTTIIRYREKTDLLSLTADEEDNVYVAGMTFSYMERVIRDFDTLYADGTDSIIGLEIAGSDTAYIDSTTNWFVKKYDYSGAFLRTTVANGTGRGYGKEIPHLATHDGILYFVDRSAGSVKANDALADSTGLNLGGLDWLDGSEIPGASDSLFVLDPSGLATDPLGHLLVSDGGFLSGDGNGRILKYTPDFLYMDRVDKNDRGLVRAPGAVASTDSLVYVYDEADSKIVLFEPPQAPE